VARYCDVLPGNVSVICGFWIYYYDLLVIRWAELQLIITFSVFHICPVCYPHVTSSQANFFHRELSVVISCRELIWNWTGRELLLNWKLSSFGTRYRTPTPTTQRKLYLCCWNMCTNCCIATVTELTIEKESHVIPSQRIHWCFVTQRRQQTLVILLLRAFRVFYGFNSYRMGETCHNINTISHEKWYSCSSNTMVLPQQNETL
jgi:hypothetical protein